MAKKQNAGEASHPSAETLGAWVEARLEGPEREAVEAHLAMCADCLEATGLTEPAPEAAPASDEVMKRSEALVRVASAERDAPRHRRGQRGQKRDKRRQRRRPLPSSIPYVLVSLAAAATVLLALQFAGGSRRPASPSAARSPEVERTAGAPEEVATSDTPRTESRRRPVPRPATSEAAVEETLPAEVARAAQASAGDEATSEPGAQSAAGNPKRGGVGRKLPGTPGADETPTVVRAPAAAENRREARTSLAYLAGIEGRAEYARGGRDRWIRARESTPLATGDRVRTKLSRARIVFESGSVVYLNHWTTLTLTVDTEVLGLDEKEKPAPPGLSVVGGEVYVETVPEDEGFYAETPHGRAVDLGTRFGLEVKRYGTTVLVAEGKVEASTDAGKVELEAGQCVLLARRASPPGPVREAQARRFAWTVLLKGAVSAEGLLALYTFTEGRGQVVRDVSCLENGLDLAIGEPNAVEWVPGGGLLLHKPTLLLSRRPARKIVDACKRTNELTVEALVRPLNVTQGSVPDTGPARIVSLSQDTVVRDFTLGQWGSAFAVRLRTSRTDANGCGGKERLGRACLFGSDAGTAAVRLTHVVMTYDRGGTARLYIDGALVAGHAVQGDFSPWGQFRLAVGAEADGSRNWLGEVRRVVIYGRALRAKEIRRAFLSAVGDGKR